MTASVQGLGTRAEQEIEEMEAHVQGTQRKLDTLEEKLRMADDRARKAEEQEHLSPN